MRLGFDLDDVVVDMAAKVEDFIGVNYGIEWAADCALYHDLKNCSFHHDKDLNDKIVESLFEAFAEEDFVLTADPIEGARDTLQKFKKSGHELYFITSRPKQLQPATFMWLRKNDIPFDGLFVIGKNSQKGIYGRRQDIDMYVDDVVSHLQSMLNYKKRWRKGLILFDKPWNNQHIDASKFLRISNWKELLRHVGIQNR